MRIANKITLLIIFLFCALALNTWLGLRQMSHIRSELAAMVKYDVGLTEAVTEVHQIQLKKNVILERLIGIGEELGFEQLSFARSSYLHDQLKNIRDELERYAKSAGQQSVVARRIAQQAMDVADEDNERNALTEILAGLNHLDAARGEYHQSIIGMLKAVEAGGFQLSLEDLDGIKRQESNLSGDVEGLLKRVQHFSHAVLERTGRWEQDTQRRLVLSLWITVIIGILFAFWIIRSIVKPLRSLSLAARQIGEGNFQVNLPTNSKDELAQLSIAFNTMSRQLEDFKNSLEKKNADLKTANDDMDKFIHIMGHDIMNPLTMMIAYCAYVEKHNEGTMDTKSLEALQGIRKAATKMHGMVKDLLKFGDTRRILN